MRLFKRIRRALDAFLAPDDLNTKSLAIPTRNFYLLVALINEIIKMENIDRKSRNLYPNSTAHSQTGVHDPPACTILIGAARRSLFARMSSTPPTEGSQKKVSVTN